MISRLTIISLVTALLVTVSCAKKDVKEDAPIGGLSASAATTTTPPSPDQTNELKKAYFDTDKSNLRADAKRDLLDDVRWLKANPKSHVTIIGHCDERGSEEYNLKLGQSRANAVKSFLTRHGISRKRLDAISKGKSEPIDPGHDESAWHQNRRVAFEVQP